MGGTLICIKSEEYAFTGVYRKHVLGPKLHKDGQEQRSMKLSLM